MNKEAIKKQSIAAYTQWCKQWRENAKINSQHEQKSLQKFKRSGVGKAVLCVANGYSLEEEIETIKKYKSNVDIICCDKSMKHLFDNGIVPKYVVVCDANVDFEKYMKDYQNMLQDTTLFMNVCANPEWAKKGNWKEKIFFCNKDVIDSHLEFMKISGCPNLIIAGTNVSNALLILLTQCDSDKRINFFGYDKILLIGFDYSWKFGGKYYAFDEDAGGKDLYMKHLHLRSSDLTPIYTSGNLWFSKNWINDYIKAFRLPVIQCAKHSLLQFSKVGDLGYQMQYNHKPEDSKKSIEIENILKDLKQKVKNYTEYLNEINKDHYMSYLKSI